MAGKRVGMARIVRGIVHNINMRKTNHTDGEDTEKNGKSRLNENG